VQNGFYTPMSPITQSVEEFISPRIQSRQVQRSLSSTLNIEVQKSNRHGFSIKNLIEIEPKVEPKGKKHSRHINNI